jgi:hypothetical protein
MDKTLLVEDLFGCLSSRELVAPLVERFSSATLGRRQNSEVLRGQPWTVRDGVSGYADDPSEILGFCARHKVLLHAEAALTTILACFSNIESIKLCVRQDPDEDAEWLLFKVVVRGTREQAFDAYRSYVRRWTGSVPLPERGLVRLSYTLA